MATNGQDLVFVIDVDFNVCIIALAIQRILTRLTHSRFSSLTDERVSSCLKPSTNRQVILLRDVSESENTNSST